MPSKKVKKQKNVTVTSVTKFNYIPDSFDLFLLNALKEKIGRPENSIIQMALLQLYTDLNKERWISDFGDSQPYNPVFPTKSPWETDIKITCDNFVNKE